MFLRTNATLSHMLLCAAIPRTGYVIPNQLHECPKSLTHSFVGFWNQRLQAFRNSQGEILQVFRIQQGPGVSSGLYRRCSFVKEEFIVGTGCCSHTPLQWCHEAGHVSLRREKGPESIDGVII